MSQPTQTSPTQTEIIPTEKIKEILASAEKLKTQFSNDHHKATAAYIKEEPDDWQDGRGWSGPGTPVEGKKGDGNAELLAAIKSTFVSEGMIQECIVRHVEGAVGREPHFTAAITRELTDNQQLTTEEKNNIAYLNAAITQFWKASDGYTEILEFTKNLIAHGRATLRVVIPKSAVTNPTTTNTTHAGAIGQIEQAPLVDIISKFRMRAPTVETSGLAKDTDKETIGAFFYAEISTNEKNKNKKISIELQTLNNQQQTVVMMVDEKNNIEKSTDGNPMQANYDVQGKLLTIERKRTALVTPSVIGQQKKLNKSHTLGSTNENLAGFLQAMALNANPPKKTIILPDGTKTDVVEAMTTGPGRIGWLQPTEIKTIDDTGNEIITTPFAADIKWREPLDGTSTENNVSLAQRTIYKAFNQLHVPLAKFHESGDALVQARGSYGASLLTTCALVESALTEVFETAIILASNFANDIPKIAAQNDVTQANPVQSSPTQTNRAENQSIKNLFKNYAITVTCRPFFGEPTAAERTSDIEDRKAGIISQETAMMRSGKVTDPATELARIKLEKFLTVEEQNKTRDSLANAVNQKLLSQFDALLELGYDKKMAAKIVIATIDEKAQMDAGVPKTQQPNNQQPTGAA